MVAIREQGDRLNRKVRTVGGGQTMPACLDGVQPARKAFVEFLEGLGLEPALVDEWRLVFTESVVNAIRHGCGEDASKEVDLEWWTDGSGVSLAVSDPGDGPEESLIAQPELPEDLLASCGRGFFIISQLCEIHEHWRSPSGYRQVLRKPCQCVIGPAHAQSGGENDAGTRTGTDTRKGSENGDMEALLDDLSMSYECLAAFHRMGSALISESGPSAFVREGIESLALVHAAEAGLIRLCLSENVHPEIREQLGRLGEVALPEEAPARAREVLDDGESFFWEHPSEVGDDAMLNAYESGCCFPVVAAGKTLGCLIIGDRQRAESQRAEDFTNLRTFSDLFGIALANCNLQIQRGEEVRALKELEIAAEIQRNLLPILPPPVSDEWEITLRHESAQEVAGDYVEACLDSEGNLVMTVIDVMGKGVSAAMLATLFRTALHMNLSRVQSLSELVESVNDVLSLQLGGVTRFITCAIIRVDAAGEHAELVNAGHAPVILMDDNGVSGQVEPSGPPLGLFPDAEYLTDRLEIGDIRGILVVTDGMFEWEMAEGGWWGWGRLLSLAAECASGGRHADVLWSQVQSLRVENGGAGAPLKDDQTMLCWMRK